MNAQKQIDEMAECLRHVCEGECVRNQDGFVDCEACKSHHLYDAGYRKQIVGEWKDNHCTICGMIHLGEEMWTRLNLTPPKFEWFMNYCPICGAKLRGGAE